MSYDPLSAGPPPGPANGVWGPGSSSSGVSSPTSPGTPTAAIPSHTGSPRSVHAVLPGANSTASANMTRAPHVPDKAGGAYAPRPPMSPGAGPQRQGAGIGPANGTRPDLFLRIRIVQMDRNRRDLTFKLDIHTNLPRYRMSNYSLVARSYSEFHMLAETLAWNCPQTIVPSIPFSTTSAQNDEEDDRIVRVTMQRWLHRVCENDVLKKDEEVRAFVESDFGYTPSPRQYHKPSTSAFSKLAMRGRGVHDDDEELAAAKEEVTRLEVQFGSAADALEQVCVARRNLAAADAETSAKLVNLATAENHPPLANGLRKMGRTVQNIAELNMAQSASEMVTLADCLAYQSANMRSAKSTLQQRARSLEEQVEASKAIISKRRNIERMKSSTSLKSDRVDEALQDLEEAKEFQKQLDEQLQAIAQNLHQALHTHSRQAHQDIQQALFEHARASLMYERQVLKEMEALRPDLRAITKRAAGVRYGVGAEGGPEGSPQVVYAPPGPPITPHTAGPTGSFTSLAPSPSRPRSSSGSDFDHRPAQSPPRSTRPEQGGYHEPLGGGGRPFDGTQSLTLGRATGHLAHGGGGPPGEKRINTMARSVFVEGERKRVDAREAASKLANMF